MPAGWKKFRYSATYDFVHDTTIHQPTLEVKIRKNNGAISIPTRMMVDSGAQDTLVRADFAEALDIDLSTCPEVPVGGITGRTMGRVHPVEIFITELNESIRVDAIFVPDMGINGLLGQLGFFDAYFVLFEKNKLSFSLKSVPALKFDEK